MPNPPSPLSQHRNPLHGVTLETMVSALVAHYGWANLAERIPLRCFISDPSIGSSLKFLRKTQWARGKVESLYLFMLRDVRRARSDGPKSVLPNRHDVARARQAPACALCTHMEPAYHPFEVDVRL